MIELAISGQKRRGAAACGPRLSLIRVSVASAFHRIPAASDYVSAIHAGAVLTKRGQEGMSAASSQAD
jgi:hypothetical protein